MGDGRMPAVLTGLAVGDALGMPFEHFSDKVDDRLIDWKGDYQPGAWPGRMTALLDGEKPMPSLPAGHWTDDTSMALSLAHSLVSVGHYDGEVVSRGYLLWAMGEPPGMGGSTCEALRAVRKGVGWAASGKHFDSPELVGNGTAMRVAPLGVFYRGSVSALLHHVEEDALITHASDEAVAASVVVAWLTAAFLSEPLTTDPLLIVDGVVGMLRLRFGETRVLAAMKSAIRHRIDGTPTLDAIRLIGRRGNAAQTTATAVYCAMAYGVAGGDAYGGSRPDFAQGVETAIRGGGDADTRGAITGALLGARLGLDAIPRHLVDGLKDAATFLRLDELLTRGHPRQ